MKDWVECLPGCSVDQMLDKMLGRVLDRMFDRVLGVAAAHFNFGGVSWPSLYRP